MPKKPVLVRTLDARLLRRAADIIKLLGHPDRLKIVEVLETGERNVSEITELCELDQAICSQHLGRLRRHGVVEARKEGLNVIYRVSEPKVHHILECIRKCDGRS